MNIVTTTSTFSGTTVSLPTPGLIYNFEVAASNIMGTGPYSSSVAVKASSSPDQITTLTVSEFPTNSSVLFTWNTPNSNYDAITTYNVYILQKSTGLFSLFTYICNGSQGVDGNGNQYCLVQMSSFISNLGY
jgi:hypothetical protein